MGGVVDSIGDAFGGAVDFVGDAVGEVANFAGDVVQDFGPEIATAIAIYYGLPPTAAGAGAGGLGAGLIAPEVAALGSLGTAGAGLGGVGAGIGSLGAIGSSLAGASLLPGGPQVGGYGGGFIKTGIDSLDTALNIGKAGFDLYQQFNQPGAPSRPIGQPVIPPLTFQQTSSGDSVNPNSFSQSLQYMSLVGLPELNDITSIITNAVSGLGNILMNAFGTDNLSEAIKKYGPAVLSIIGGKLSYDDQKRINDIVMGAYNKYNVGTELKKTQYRTGQGLASLPVSRSGRPLGSQTVAVAPQRTAADVVVRPGAQMGGIMSAMPMDYGQPLQVSQPTNNSFAPMQNIMSNPMSNYGQTPLMMAGGGSPEDEMEDMKEFYYNRKRGEMEDLLDEYERFKMKKDFMKKYPRDEARKGGRMKLAIGSSQQPMQMQLMNRTKGTQGIGRTLVTNAMKDPKFKQILQQVQAKKSQTRSGFRYGSLPMRTNQAGITELDYRQKGGFVPPIGIKEKADDIPAMLSNNEFVFTADAVRAAGGGSVKKGAERMYGLMNKLEGRA